MSPCPNQALLLGSWGLGCWITDRLKSFFFFAGKPRVLANCRLLMVHFPGWLKRMQRLSPVFKELMTNACSLCTHDYGLAVNCGESSEHTMIQIHPAPCEIVASIQISNRQKRSCAYRRGPYKCLSVITKSLSSSNYHQDKHGMVTNSWIIQDV
jgi:hypothetical protein